MRPIVAALVVLSVLLALPPPAVAEDFGAIGKVNKLISVIESPQLAPGASGTFRFEFNSTYASAITDVRLNASIFMYATIEGAIPVDDAWPYEYPRIRETSGREWWWNQTTVPPMSAYALEFTIDTAADSRAMPHGSVFSQASYFVRFWVEFDGDTDGNVTRYRFASRGFFTQDRWAQATNASFTNPCNAPSCRGNVNLTILGVDGILPDSAFGVKEPIPVWPFYLLIALAVGFLVFAFLFWVEENPGRYPRIDAWWARTRGRFVRARRTLPTRKPPSA